MTSLRRAVACSASAPARDGAGILYGMKELRERRDDQPAFVLHTYPYRETSLIVEAFTESFGRVAMVARGAKRPRSEMRGVLQAFQPLALSWAGTGELKTLVKAEWRGGLPLPSGGALL